MRLGALAGNRYWEDCVQVVVTARIVSEGGSALGSIKFEVVVNAPLQQVWDLGRMASRIPEWQFDISSVEDCPGRIEGAGTRYTLIYLKAGLRLASPVEVTRYEPENHFMETTGKTPIGGYFRSSTRMESEGSSTRLMWNMDYALPGGFIGQALDVAIFREGFRRTVRKYIANLKALAEKEAAHAVASSLG